MFIDASNLEIPYVIWLFTAFRVIFVIRTIQIFNLYIFTLITRFGSIFALVYERRIYTVINYN